MAKLTTKEKVRNGARWLDENFPGWEGRINLDTLDLSDGTQCICGQVFGRTPAGRKRPDSGYGYAWDNLFSEANSWITAIVKAEPISRRYKLNNWEDWFSRVQKVSTVLGFDGTSANQREWKIYLAERLAQNS